MKKIRLATLFMILAMILAACGTGGDNTGNDNTSPGTGFETPMLVETPMEGIETVPAP